MSDQRVLRGIAATLSWQNVDQDGVAAAPAGAVTVRVQHADGTDVLAAGTATAGTSSDPRTVTLTPAQVADLDQLTASWTDAGDGSVHQTVIDVVGGYYLSIAQLRALPNLSDTAKFTSDEVIEARRWFEEEFERYTHVAWVPRFRRLRLSGSGDRTLVLPNRFIRRVRSVRVYADATTYTAFSNAELADIQTSESGSGVITRSQLGSFMAGQTNIVVEYEHGQDAPFFDIKEAAKVAIRDHLLDANVGNRQFSVQTDQGVVRTSTPGPDRPFGIPFVDEVANARRELVGV